MKCSYSNFHKKHYIFLDLGVQFSSNFISGARRHGCPRGPRCRCNNAETFGSVQSTEYVQISIRCDTVQIISIRFDTVVQIISIRFDTDQISIRRPLPLLLKIHVLHVWRMTSFHLGRYCPSALF